jgi:hypothetical protein
MGFLKEINKYFLKFGEIAIKKTETAAQLAKVKIEIKKREMGIEKIKIEIGDYVITRFEEDEQISNDVLKQKIDSMNSFKQGIDELKNRFETLKSELVSSSSENKEGEKPE